MEALHYMKAFKTLFVLSLLLTYCGETIKSDIYVKPKYSISKNSKVLIGYFSVRTHVPYARLNFKDQLEFHLLKRDYKILPKEMLVEFYRENKIRLNRSLNGEEIKEAHNEIRFDILIQGVIYEEDQTLFDKGNHIIVHLNLYDPQGKKVSTIRYIYHGERSLISGELIDESINELLDHLDSYQK